MELDIKKEVFEINKDTIATLSKLELDQSKVYVVQIEVGDCPMAQVKAMCINLKEVFAANNVKVIIIPTFDGIGAVTIKELQEYEEDNNN